MDIQEWALNRFTPVVMVKATAAAEAMCEEKNGLSVTDMLRPYGDVHNISVPVRTVGEQSIRINGFRLRLHEASTIFQPALEAAEAHLAQVLAAAGEQHHALECFQSMEEIRAAVASGRDLTPWFSAYRDELFRILSFTDFETFDHPVACLFVADANSDEVPAAFQQLDRPDTYPWLMQHGVMDPNLLKHYILLCDDSVGSEERAQMKAAALSSTYGANHIHVIKINSGTGNPADSGGVPDIWKACQYPCVPGGGGGEPESRVGTSDDADLGVNLTAADLEGIALFMRDFTMRSLLPFLEARIRALNLQINATRRGLKNSLKALWWRKERSEVLDGDKSPAAAAGMYNFATVESQMRCLSDLAFMVRDYSLATSTLRLLQGDYKADKALRHYAGAQEMLALSLLMSGEGGSTREAEDCLSQAYGSYSQCGGGYLRYATRSMLHLTEIHKAAGRFRDAKASLMKAHFEEVHVRAALLLEQTAICLLKSDPPLERKFAFHLVLAGLRYHQCDQRLLAERAYSQVLVVYNGRNWSLIEEHLNDVLGRYTQDKGDIHTTVQHTMALLGSCKHRNETVQEHYMRQFSEAVKESERRMQASGQASELPLRLDLPLPVVAADSAVVHVDGVRYKGNAAAYEVEDAVWDRMHDALAIGGAASALGGSASSNWLAGRSGGEPLVKNVCCVNEEVGIDIEFSNPLSITLQVTDIRLLCELKRTSGTPGQDGEAADEAACFTVRPQDLTLRSRETSKLGLMVTPLVPGLLRVLGVEWCLNGTVHGRRLFTQRTEPRWRGDTSHQRLMFSVITPMPRLEAALHGLPSVLYAGEMTRCFLELRNCGGVPMRGLRLAVSHPGEVLCSARPVASRSEATAPLDKALWDEAAVPGTWISTEEGRGPDSAQLMPLPPLPSGEKPSMFHSSATRVWRLPKDTVLEEGSEAFWPLWICPSRIGTHAFELAVYFEKAGGGSEGVMRHRVLCIGQTMSVVPSLQVQASVLGDATQLRRSLLHLSVHNFPQANESFHIRQISCITPGVELRDLPTAKGPNEEDSAEGTGYATDLPADAEVDVGETSSLFLHIEKRGGEVPAPPPAPGTLPVRSGPLQWFHECAQDAAGRGTGGLPRSSVAAAVGTALVGLQIEEPAEFRAKVVVVWEVRSQGRTRRLGATLAERQEVPAERQQPPPPLRAALKGPHTIMHDFNASPLCVVPLKLSVANGLPHATAVTIDCGAPGMSLGSPTAPGTWHHTEDAVVTASAAAAASSGASASALGQSPNLAGVPPSRQCGLTPAGCWQWCGQSQLVLGALQPEAASDAQLQVVVFAPGHFRIGSYRLAYSDADLALPGGTLDGPACTLTILHQPSESTRSCTAPPHTPTAPANADANADLGQTGDHEEPGALESQPAIPASDEQTVHSNNLGSVAPQPAAPDVLDQAAENDGADGEATTAPDANDAEQSGNESGMMGDGESCDQKGEPDIE